MSFLSEVASDMENQKVIKKTVRASISPKDKGIRPIEKEFREFKQTLIPKIQEALEPVVKDKEVNMMAQQQWAPLQMLKDYIYKRLPLHPMPIHRQSVKIEKKENGDKPPNYYLHIKNKSEKSSETIGCLIKVAPKHRDDIELASGGDFGENPHLRQVELIEDKKYGRINAHISLELPAPEEYEPKGWLGVDTGWKKLACSIIVDENGCRNPSVHAKEYKSRIIQIKTNMRKTARTKDWKKWNNRWQNTTKYVTGVVAKEIVNKAKKHKCGVVMEDLTFRAHTKQFLIPRYKLMQAVKTLCERKGVPFMLVNPKYTSQTCPKCKTVDKKNRDGSRFKCIECDYKADADISAAMNIGRAAIDKGLAPLSKADSDLSDEAGEVATP